MAYNDINPSGNKNYSFIEINCTEYNKPKHFTVYTM